MSDNGRIRVTFHTSCVCCGRRVIHTLMLTVDEATWMGWSGRLGSTFGVNEICALCLKDRKSDVG